MIDIILPGLCQIRADGCGTGERTDPETGKCSMSRYVTPTDCPYMLVLVCRYASVSLPGQPLID